MRAIQKNIRDIGDLYDEAQELPQRAGRLSYCTRLTDRFYTVLSFASRVKNGATSRLANATVTAAQKTFRCMPRFVQRKYDNYCLSKAEKIADRLAIPGVVNQIAASPVATLWTQWISYIQNNHVYGIARTFGSFFYPELVRAIDNPKEAALNRTVVPIIKMAHELLAQEGFKALYGIGVDILLAKAIAHPLITKTPLSTLNTIHSYGISGVRTIQMTLLALIYGPTVAKAIPAAYHLYQTYDKMNELRQILFSPKQVEMANQLAARSGIQGITGAQVLQAALLLLLN